MTEIFVGQKKKTNNANHHIFIIVEFFQFLIYKLFAFLIYTFAIAETADTMQTLIRVTMPQP